MLVQNPQARIPAQAVPAQAEGDAILAHPQRFDKRPNIIFDILKVGKLPVEITNVLVVEGEVHDDDPPSGRDVRLQRPNEVGQDHVGVSCESGDDEKIILMLTTIWFPLQIVGPNMYTNCRIGRPHQHVHMLFLQPRSEQLHLHGQRYDP
mmetsp:Transcript_7963/g.10663  ORF Transcript_7963/g.10663 Transcript_7963/m.10663 type:complete len:150 (+) Transcript_7963:541-990(+)